MTTKMRYLGASNIVVAAVCLLATLVVIRGALAEQCGWQAEGALCPNGLCCSQHGWCGRTPDYCGQNCQSQCGGTPAPVPPSPPTGGDVTDIISSSTFNQMLLHRNGFYSYDAFVSAARSFPGFATAGDTTIRKREVAAFFAQTSHETTGGWPTAPDGRYAWGYYFIKEQGNPGSYCDPNNQQWPCAPGKSYYGRGPIQISHNYNYGPAGRAIGVDLLNNPDLVETDPNISFKTAIWFWMTAQPPKPSCHSVMIGEWTPSDADRSAGRVAGFGLTTNIINGGIECGHGSDPRVDDRIGFYRRYCEILGVSPGDNLDCGSQKSYAFGLRSVQGVDTM